MNSEIELIPFIKQALINIETKEFKRTNSTAILSLRVLSGAIFVLCRDAFTLLENNRIFTACSLTCQAIEAQIQLLCIDKMFDTKGRDYYEFAFVEQLKSLSINPQWQEKTLLRMQHYNCERFYTGKGKNTSDIDSYYKNWYRSFANSIKDLSKIAFPYFKEIFHSQGIVFMEEDLNIDLLYENYQTLCSFKHLSPFIVGETFLVQGKLFEEQKINHKEVALTSIYTALISVILVLNRHGEQIPIEGCLFNRA